MGNTASTAQARQGNGGISMLLFLIFLVLKLTGSIGWSWWWITAPLWAPAALALGILAVILSVAVVAALVKNRK